MKQMTNETIVQRVRETPTVFAHLQIPDETLCAMFEECMDAVEPPTVIFDKEYSTAKALRLLDPAGYRAMFSDYLDYEVAMGFLIKVDESHYKTSDVMDVIDGLSDQGAK